MKETLKFNILKLRVSSVLLRRLTNIAGKKGMPPPDLINLVLMEYAESESLVEELDNGNFTGSSKRESGSDTDEQSRPTIYR